MPANGSANLIPGANAKKVSKCDSDGTVIEKFSSIAEAGRITGICCSSISSVASGSLNHKTAGDFLWRYW